jgi:protein-S-isoprenylcysteine O-methyltransferase Ste14
MNNQPQSMPGDKANVIMLPPFIILIPLVVGVLLHYLVLKLQMINTHSLGHMIGWPLVVLGVLLMFWSVKTMRGSGEDEDVRTPTHSIVKSGPYKYTRNPIYLSFVITYLGLTLIINTWWLLIFLPIAVLVIHFGVILREEKYLKVKLGDQYQAYLEKVTRWL